MGFDARWGVVSAADVGAPHQRNRIWILANANGLRQLQQEGFEQNERGRFGDLGGEMANSNNPRIERRQQQPEGISIKGNVADASDIRSRSSQADRELEGKRFAVSGLGCEWWDREPGQTSREVESDVGRVAHGVAARVDRLKAIGNGQVPAVAATAWRLLRG
jgi:DNA (cytosine-5)-methyltransferase 1